MNHSNFEHFRTRKRAQTLRKNNMLFNKISICVWAMLAIHGQCDGFIFYSIIYIYYISPTKSLTFNIFFSIYCY